MNLPNSAHSNVAQPLVQAGLLGEAIDAAPVAVFVCDEHGTYVAVNQTACDLLGYSRQEILALSPQDIAPGADVPRRFEELVRTGSLDGTSTLRRKDGGEVRVGYRSSETKAAGMAFYVSVAWPEPE